jgi:hypothetical protein
MPQAGNRSAQRSRRPVQGVHAPIGKFFAKVIEHNAAVSFVAADHRITKPNVSNIVTRVAENTRTDAHKQAKVFKTKM